MERTNYPKNANKSKRKQTYTATRGIKRAKERFKLFSIRAGLDMPFLILVLILVAIGLVMLFSASYANAYYQYNDSYYFIKTQLPMALFGIAGMIFVSYVDYRALRKASVPLLIVSFVLLLAVLFMPAMNDVHRWVQLGSFSFQASEITKFAIILFFSDSISRNFNRMTKARYGLLPYALVLAPTILLLLLEPHISCTVIVVILAVILLIVGGAKLKWFAVAGGILAAGAVGLLLFTDKLSYANTRIAGWLNPFNQELWQETYQTRNSLYAIGSGGLLGLGLGNSRQKYMYLPEPQNDFIFAVVCEELGFIGATIILLIFVLLVWRGITISIKSKDKFANLLGIGLSAQVGLQVILNVGVVTNLIPNTGISLPFFSHGGTSLVILLLEMGVILSISRTSRVEKVMGS